MKEKNKTVDISDLRKAVKREQSRKRYEHTLGVEFTAAALAMRYDCDIMQARIAGLLHDCAKCFTDKELLEYCMKHHISFTETERRNPYLLHSKVGACIAQKDYGIEDTDILNAIQNHTTGRPEMSLLEKVIFIADYIEPGRNKASNLAEIRRLAFVNLDAALCKILEDTLVYLKTSGGEIDSGTEETLKYYSKYVYKCKMIHM